MKCLDRLVDRLEIAPAAASTMNVSRDEGRAIEVRKTTTARAINSVTFPATPMENRGFEPLTSAVRSQRSTS